MNSASHGGDLRSEAIVAGQLRGLPNPIHQQLLIERVVLVDVEVTHVWLFGLDRREGA